MKLRVAVFTAMLMVVGVACEEPDEPAPTTTTTEFNDVPTTSTTRSSYVPAPLPRNGWTVDQGAQFKTRLYRIIDPRIVSTQPDVIACSADWFISFYTPEELLEFADDDLIKELSEEGVAFCGQWTKIGRQNGI